MEGFYSRYRHTSVYNAVKWLDKDTDTNKSFKINWIGREAESIIFDNKIYTFKLFYEKKNISGHLHFWRLNEENKWERLSILDNTCYNDMDILNPDFILHYFYVWTADNPGDITEDSLGTSTRYYILV